MHSLEKIKKQIAGEINKALKNKFIQASDFVYPPDSEMGDLSLPCFDLAKKLGKNPAEIARNLVKRLSSGNLKSDSSVKTVIAVGPYINFILDKLF